MFVVNKQVSATCVRFLLQVHSFFFLTLHFSPLLHCRRALICLEVLSSFRCRVVYLEKKVTKREALTSVRTSRLRESVNHKHRLSHTHTHTHLSAFRSPSTLLDGCSFSTLMQPFICVTQRENKVSEKGQRPQIHLICCSSWDSDKYGLVPKMCLKLVKTT